MQRKKLEERNNQEEQEKRHMELFWAPTASVFDTANKEDIDNRPEELDYGLNPVH